jgi:hypothetical protein
LNLAIEFGFTLRGLLACQETVACRPCHRIVERRLRRCQTAVEVVAARRDLGEQVVQLGLARGETRDVAHRRRMLPFSV